MSGSRLGFVLTTVGAPVPAKPSEGMPAELDPGTAGRGERGMRGRVQMCQGQKPNKAC